MESIEGTGLIVAEPDWSTLFSDVLDVAAASGHWQRLATELRQRQLLASVNGHSLQRLVIAYVIYDRAAQQVAENGAVTKPKLDNPKAIAWISPHFAVMRGRPHQCSDRPPVRHGGCHPSLSDLPQLAWPA